MTLAILVAISLMWLSVAILFLGKGEAKGTGAITGFVGLTVVVGAFLICPRSALLYGVLCPVGGA